MLAGPGACVGDDAAEVTVETIAQAGEPLLPLANESVGTGAVELGATEIRALAFGAGAGEVVANGVNGVRSKNILAPDRVPPAGGELLAFEQVELVDVVVDVRVPFREGQPVQDRIEDRVVKAVVVAEEVHDLPVGGRHSLDQPPQMRRRARSMP